MKKDRVQDKFLEELKKIPIVQVACEKVGISRQSVYRWRMEDENFRLFMDVALEEGEALVNDMSESKLLAHIKEGHFSSIRFWLTKRHPKFKDNKGVLQTPTETEKEKEKSDRVIKALGLTSEDFMEENYPQTLMRIAKYLREYPSS